MKGENMKYLLLIIVLVATIISAGCLNGSTEKNTIPTKTQTPIPTTVTVKQAMIEKLLDEDPVIPTDIVYKKAGSEENRKAFDKLSGFFLATNKTAIYDNLFSDMLVCGPGLWRNIKDDAEMRQITTGVTQLRIPTQEGVQTREGKIFQRKEEVESFQRAFVRQYKFDSQTVIRRPTARELRIYWAMIPYDIEEPIFIVESKDATILVDFVGKEDARISWIDDYRQIQ